MATKDKNIWVLLIFILSGLVVGGLIGNITSSIDSFNWIGYGQEFGFETPLQVDLGVINITFGLMININIASIIGMAIAVFIYRKI